MPRRRGAVHIFPFLATALVSAACVGGGGRGTDTQGARSSNELVLSPADSNRLVHWAKRFAACMAHRGIHLGRLVVTRREIRMPLPRA